MGVQKSVSEPGVLLTDKERDIANSKDTKLAEQFTAQLLSAKHSVHDKHPWVMVTSIKKGKTLLSVYSLLKNQGLFDDWSSEFYDVRQDSGICVLALMP